MSPDLREEKARVNLLVHKTPAGQTQIQKTHKIQKYKIQKIQIIKTTQNEEIQKCKKSKFKKTYNTR